MSDDKLTIKEGTTSDIPMQLLADGNPIDLTVAASVQVTMLDALRKVYHYSTTDISPAVVITVPASGTITFTPPDQTVFRAKNSPYKVVTWVYASNGKKYACPEKDADLIFVQPAY
jgi:hypothetical protein